MITQRPTWTLAFQFFLFVLSGLVTMMFSASSASPTRHEAPLQEAPLQEAPSQATHHKKATQAEFGVSLLFDSDVVSDNVYTVLSKAKLLAPSDRYDFLSEVNLSHSADSPFRIQAKFVAESGQFVTPAFEWIEAARESGRLDEMRRRIEGLAVRDEVQLRFKLSLLAMIALTADQNEVAAAITDQLFQRFVTLRFPNFRDRLPETLLLVHATERAMLAEECLSFLTTIVDTQVRANKNHGPEAWDTMMVNSLGRVRYNQLPVQQRLQKWGQPPELKSWHRVTRRRSWSSGSGIPSGYLQFHDGTVQVRGKHEDEYIVYESPLQGNFSLECLCTGFGWKEMFPMIGGLWLSPVYHHRTFQYGDVVRAASEQKIEPHLSSTDEWIHYRVDVHDGVVSRFINGRETFRHSLPQNSDPWVAIRNPSFVTGTVKNVHITGNPQVPEQVVLSEVRSSLDQQTTSKSSLQPYTCLSGWIPWYEDPWQPDLCSWKVRPGAAGKTEIIGQKNTELPEVALERFLRYHWPLVWDADVTWEFYYNEGHSAVHPALGRLALLLDPMGVRCHRITNGYHDHTELDPANQFNVSNQFAEVPVPLRNQDWNSGRMKIRGDSITIQINEQTVFEGSVTEESDRNFGFFYYADATEARIRNVVLKGDWPKAVPPVPDQELRSIEADVLDRERDSLADSFEFDFASAGAQDFESKFRTELSQADAVTVTRQGLRMGGTGFKNGQTTHSTGPRLRIDGDFDVIAEYADLQLEVSENGSSAIYLGFRRFNPEHRANLLYHGLIRHPDTPLRGISQVEILETGSKGFRFSYPAIKADDFRAGRLRLARRGEILHYLIAPGDSPRFRILHSMPDTNIPILSGDFMLRSSCYSAGKTPSTVNVLWKNLSIRAESIDISDMNTTSPRSLYVLDLRKATTTKPEPLLQANASYRYVKWPRWTADGKTIVSELSNGSVGTVMLLNLSPSSLRSVGTGTSPDLSPDGSQMVLSSDQSGVQLCAIDDWDQRISLDPNGIGAVWSPNGQTIAWISGNRITLYETRSQQLRTIPELNKPLSWIALEKGMQWSPDGKSLAFKARIKSENSSTAAIATIDLANPDSFQVLWTAARLHSNISWHPDSDQILFSGLAPSLGVPQMFIVKRSKPGSIESVPGQPENWRIIDCDWSPDGHRIAFTAEPKIAEPNINQP